MKKLLLVGMILSSLSACAIRKDLQTPFDPNSVKQIIHDGDGANGSTKDCTAGADGKYDGATVNISATGFNDDGSAAVDGGGCILRPIREVWAAMNNLEAMKWEAADSFTYTRTINPTADFTHLYAMTYNKSTLIGEIAWTINWYFGVDRGTFAQPEHILVSYGRVSGTSNIPIWNGAITLTKITDTVTAIEIHNNFKARQSSSDNASSTKDCLNELIGHARNATPDWTRLNTGFKANPSQPDPPAPDDPNAAAELCVKDANGNYPTTPVIDLESDQGVSIVNLHACVPMTALSLYTKMKTPSDVLWSNADNATATVSPTSVNTQVVAYNGSHGVFHSTYSWTQDWTFTATAATTTSPEHYLIEYKMDPATSDFPVWQGAVSITAVDANTAAIVIQNHLLLDSVSGSPDQNKTLAQGLLSKLAPGTATAP